MKTIYQEMLKADVEIDNHESDLYVPVTEKSKAIVQEYEHRQNVTTFRSNIDGALWYDIPFAFDPFWQRAERICEAWAAGACNG